ncbi:uncharacterized protein LOC130614337 [Hydractinia symbiolongicarpus]|uniref:uncharacterized protein LOC130614337 n=1 Tax=Hydractinia symbiolongicarpus TaxID=13093 RepID=UPI00254CE28D|nr:uncharacterized protein LOC130614337 [Hydractinia symbiolongicarpus]
MSRYTVAYADNIGNVREKLKQEGIRKLKIFICSKNATGVCNHCPFKSARTRDLHEKLKHNMDRREPDVIQQPIIKDHVLCYQKALFTINLLLKNLNDAIRQGDGERLIESYKLVLLYFKATQRHKYAYTILKLLYRIRLEPENAFKLTWGRFIYTQGYKGRNISNDLHLGHLNHFLKELLRSLRSNINEKNAERVSYTLQNMKGKKYYSYM